MGKFNSLLKTLRNTESAANRGDWLFVAKKMLNLEKEIMQCSVEEFDNLDDGDKLEFNSAREIHSRIKNIVITQQDDLLKQISNLRQGSKASQAYGENKRNDNL